MTHPIAPRKRPSHNPSVARPRDPPMTQPTSAPIPHQKATQISSASVMRSATPTRAHIARSGVIRRVPIGSYGVRRGYRNDLGEPSEHEPERHQNEHGADQEQDHEVPPRHPGLQLGKPNPP